MQLITICTKELVPIVKALTRRGLLRTLLKSAAILFIMYGAYFFGILTLNIIAYILQF